MILALALTLGTLVSVQGCGYSPVYNPFIVNGDETSPNQYPWQVSLESCSGSSCSHICGGVLISNQWVVTAAHCVGYSASSYQIRVGHHYVNDASKQSVKVSAIYKHESYSENSNAGYPNDIAVVRLATTLTLSSTVNVVCMPSMSDYTTNTQCYISGWGVYRQNGQSLSSVLLHAHVRPMTNSQCQAQWGSVISSVYHQCVKDDDNVQGACNGDSGGPLVCRVNGIYELVGTTSWGINGCNPRYPGVYAKTASYRSWIRSKTGV